MRFISLLLCLVFSSSVWAQDATDPFEAIEAAKVHFEEVYRAGDYDAARDIADAAIALAEESWGENAVVALEMRLKFAQAVARKHGNTEARIYFRDVYTRWQENYPEAHPGRMLAQIEYARVLSTLDEAEEALPLALKAVRYAEQVFGADEEVTYIWKATLAGIYYKLGYLNEAVATYETLLAFFGDRPGGLNPRRAAIYAYDLAQLLDEAGYAQDAAPYWQETAERMKVAFGEMHPTAVDAGLNRLINLYRVGEYDLMRASLTDLEPRVEKVYGTQSPHMFLLRERRALLQATTTEKGSPAFLDAAAEMRAVATYYSKTLGETSERAGKAWLDLSPILTDAGDAAGALEAALNAEDAGSGSRNTLYYALRRAVETGVLSEDAAAEHAFRIAQLTHNGKFKAAARSQGLRLEFGRGAVADAYRELTDRVGEEQTMQQVLAGLVNLPLNERDPAQERALQADLATNAAEILRLTSFLKDNEPAGAAMLGDAELSLSEAQRLLLPHEALVLFDIDDDDDGNHHVIAVTRDRVVWRLTGTTRHNMGLAAADTRESIDLKFGLRAAESLDEEDDGEQDDSFNFYAASFLYDMTFGTVEDVIGDKTHWFVDLRGPLSGLPPQLLLKRPLSDETTWDTVEWVVRDHAITVIPSAFALKVTELAQATQPDRKSLLAFADPDFGARPEDTIQVASLSAGQGALRGALAPLPETRDEVRAVAEALGPDSGVLFEGRAATEATVKSQRLQDYEILYFATHGLIAGDLVRDGELAEPALALTAGDGEDGLLTQSEVAGLKLDADLVVLSACNTAVGGEPGAEALSGLAQAFSYAGARALMVSHWPVESQSAVALMTEMFSRRAATPGLPMAEAQRAAILSLLDNPRRPEWQHPAYWAPFVLVGDPD
ncbi:CHAT domain-containing protein [Shimia sp.]|uniref:CHAT domain-containing protein n=1 Tax=Shimia sp. TaxID=1954381 RepID=UPI00329A033C